MCYPESIASVIAVIASSTLRNYPATGIVNEYLPPESSDNLQWEHRKRRPTINFAGGNIVLSIAFRRLVALLYVLLSYFFHGISSSLLLSSSGD